MEATIAEGSLKSAPMICSHWTSESERAASKKVAARMAKNSPDRRTTSPVMPTEAEGF